MKTTQTNRTRRNVLRSIPVFVAATAVGARAADKEDGAAKKEQPEFLFVQTANEVTYDGTTMTLHGVSPTTLFFSIGPSGSQATASPPSL